MGAVPSNRCVGKRMRSIGSLLGALVVVLTVAGCGGSDGDETTRVSKAEFVKEGGAICVATRKGIRSDFEAFTRSSEGRELERAEKANELTPVEAAAKVGEEIIVPAMRQELEEFRALGIPDGDDDQVNALLEAFEEGAEKAEEHPERAATDGTEAFGGSGDVADDFGLVGC